MRVKKHLAVVLAVFMIAMILLPTTTAEAASNYSYIKVKLSSMGSVTSVKFTINGEYYIKDNPYYELVRGKTYTIKTSGSGISLVDGSNTTYLGKTAEFVRCESSNSVNWITLNNTKTGWTAYPGDLIFLRSGSYITTICKLFMETYLVGVVAHEMSPNWPAEALKAQAVAARTYAMRYIYPGNTYDVVDTSSNQVYKGFNPDRDAPVIAAINATKGLAMRYGSDFADGVYSASNGGQTQSRVPVWGRVNLYHELKDDPYDMKNPASPRFEFDFPKMITTSNKLDSRLQEMLLSKMSAKLSISKSTITILGIDKVTPYELPPSTKYGAYPAGSRKFQKVGVMVNYTTEGNVVTPVDPTPEITQDSFAIGTVKLQSSSRLRIRSGPSTSDSIVGYVPNGGKVEIFQQRSDGWFKIKYNNINGYIYGIYVTIDVEDPAPATPTPEPTPAPENIDKDAKISGQGQSIALKASTNQDSAILAYISDGTDIYVISKTHDGWLKLEYNTLIGYVKEENVIYTDDIDAAPTATDATPTATDATPSPVVTPTPTPSASYQQVNVSLVFDDLQEQFKSDSSYLKYHSILEVYETTDNKTIVLRAGRFGHGIGLSQRGAQQMANEGQTYEQILQYYYKGTTLSDMQPAEQPLPVKAEIPTTIGVVNADSLNVRSGPGPSYSVITSIKKGESVNVIVEDTWCKIYVPSKKVVGYVSKQYLNITRPQSTPTPEKEFEVHQGIYKVTATRLNMRSGPSTDFAVIGILDNGELVTKYDASATFIKIKDSNGNEGWCSSKYLEMVSGAVTPTPAPTPELSGSVQPDKKIYLRQSISATSLVLAVLEDEAVFVILFDRTDGWLEIVYNDITGFIEDDFAVFDGSKEDYYPSGTLTADETMYVQADVTSDEVINISEGSDVWILADGSDGYVMIEYESETGFILDDNLTFDGIKEDIETPTPTPTSTEEETPTPASTEETPTPTEETPAPTSTEETPTPAPEAPPTGILTADETMYSIAKTYGEVLKDIPSGSEVEIITDRTDGWVKISYDFIEGFILDDNLTFDGNKEVNDSYKGPWAKVLSGTQTIYNEPSITAYVLKYVSEGSYVKLIDDRNDGFIKVDDQTIVGYMLDDNMEFDGTKENPEAPSAIDEPSDDDPSELIGTITASTGSVRLRKSASLTSDILAYMAVGSQVVILEDRDDGWVYVNYNDLLGYIVDDFVDFDGTKEDHDDNSTPQPVSTPPVTSVVTGKVMLASTSSRLRIRSSASTSSSILGHVPHGASVKVLEQLSNGWMKIEYSGITGFVSGQYVKINAAAAATIGTIKDCSMLNVRKGPDTSYGTLGQIKVGSKVTILGSSNGWYKISYSGSDGWISGKYVSVATENTNTNTTGTGTVTASSLRVRSGAGLNYSQIGSLAKNTVVQIIGESGSFYKINYKSSTGYVSKTYINKT